MGVNDNNKEEILARLAADTGYGPRFARAYPGQAAPITWGNVIHAISAFQRTILSGNSKYDQYLKGSTALNPAEQRGMNLFFGEKARSEEHTSELQSPCNLVCRLLLEKKNK